MAVTNRALGFEVPPERLRMAGCGSFTNVLDTIEHAITTSPFIAGDRFTAADVYVGSHIGYGLNFGTIEKRPAFIDYWSRVSDRDAYRRGNELDNAAMPKKPNA